MSKLCEWIEEMADGQPVEAVVIGEMGWGDDYGSDAIPNYAECPRGIVLTWGEARPWLEYEFFDGFGAPRCQSITAWTANWVIFVSTYDGSTSPCRVPRNPVEHMPEMPGGG